MLTGLEDRHERMEVMGTSLDHVMIVGGNPLEWEQATPEGWRDLARESGARYLFWGSQEREAYPESSQPWREQARLVTRGEWGEIYDLSQVAAPLE